MIASIDDPVAMTTHTKFQRTRVLTVQSQVIHGHVGNSASTFPLQLLGVDVDSFNILSFTNHTGYPLFKGHFITPEQFQVLAEGLKANGFTKGYDCVLSGFLGNVAMMEEVHKLVSEILTSGAQCAYVCDPVCGDNGKLYVAEACVGMFVSTLLPLSVVATPNGYEASLLSGRETISCLAEARESANWFHTVPKVPFVVIKSFEDASRDPTLGTIFMLVSVAFSCEVDGEGHLVIPPVQWLISVPKLVGYFVGTGDVFAGVLVGNFRQTGLFGGAAAESPIASIGRRAKLCPATAIAPSECDLKVADGFRNCVCLAAAGTLAVLENTQAARAVADDADDAVKSFDERELLLVHSQRELLNPPADKLKVEKLLV